MANTTNFGWETPDDTDLVKDGAAAIRTLGSAIDTSLVDLKGGTTGQVLSKASNTDMDFTWVAQDDSNAIQNAIVDAKGDLITATAADTPARLAVGTNDQVLMADSSTATGLKWGTPSSGGYTLLSEQTASGLSSLSFSSISGSYKHLYLVWSGVYHSGNDSNFHLRINNDSGSNYYPMEFGGYGGTFSASLVGTARTVVTQQRPLFGASVSSSNIQATAIGYFFLENYASTSKVKRYFTSVSFYDFNLDYLASHSNGVWDSTSAVTSLDIVRTTGVRTFTTLANHTIRLYGVS